MNDQYTFTYDAQSRSATIELSGSGEKLRIANISSEQAARWEKDKAAEFVKRGFRMHTPAVNLTREAAHE